MSHCYRHRVSVVVTCLVCSAHSRRCEGLQGAHRDWSTLHDLLEEAVVIQTSLTLCTDLGHHLYSLCSIAPCFAHVYIYPIYSN